MTVVTHVPHLGALMRAGQALACPEALPARVAAALDAVAPAFGATAVRVRSGSRVVATYGVPANKRPVLAVPLRFGDRVVGELAAWRQGPFGVSDEQGWHVFADSLALALDSDSARAGAAAAAIAAADDERDSLAGEVHDGLLQTLVAARISAELAGADSTAIRAATRDGRELAWRLRSRTPGGALVAALDALAERDGEVAVRVDAGVVSPASPGVTATLAYRLVQAALAPCAAAGARVVDVRLRPVAGEGVRVTIGHDAAGSPYAGAALERWIDRLAAVGGSVAWGSGAGWLVFDIPGRPEEGVRP